MLDHFQQVIESHPMSADMRTGISHSFERPYIFAARSRRFPFPLSASAASACTAFRSLSGTRSQASRYVHQLCRAHRKQVDIAYNRDVPETKPLYHLKQLLHLACIVAQLGNDESRARRELLPQFVVLPHLLCFPRLEGACRHSGKEARGLERHLARCLPPGFRTSIP